MRLMPQIFSTVYHSTQRLQGKEGKIVHGKQSLQNLSAQNRELSSIQVADEDIKALKNEFKSYAVDFSVFHDKADQSTHIFFKAQDVERVYAAFTHVVKSMNKEQDRPHAKKLDEAIQQAKQRAEAYNKAHSQDQAQNQQRQKSRGERAQ